MDLEGIRLSKTIQTKKDKYCMVSLIRRTQKIPQTSEYNKKEAENKLVVNSGERVGEKQYRGRGLKDTNAYA